MGRRLDTIQRGTRAASNNQLIAPARPQKATEKEKPASATTGRAKRFIAFEKREPLEHPAVVEKRRLRRFCRCFVLLFLQHTIHQTLKHNDGLIDACRNHATGRVQIDDVLLRLDHLLVF